VKTLAIANQRLLLLLKNDIIEVLLVDPHVLQHLLNLPFASLGRRTSLIPAMIRTTHSDHENPSPKKTSPTNPRSTEPRLGSDARSPLVRPELRDHRRRGAEIRERILNTIAVARDRKP
jgi:hypothetical protein